MRQVTITNTVGFLALCKNAEGRNRSVYTKKVAKAIDPAGTHVMGFQMPHNDVEWRTQWYCKFLDSDDPVELWLDVSFEKFTEMTETVTVQLPKKPPEEDDDEDWLDL